MSRLIKQMLADRARAADAHEGARRRVIIEPIRKAFYAGFNIMRQDRAKMDAKMQAFAEGADTGLFDIGCDVETAWLISDARKGVLAKLDGQ